MPDARTAAFVSISAIVLFGTAYSVIYNTSLDTSNPLLTNLAHPLQKTHYFARKSSFLNVYFIKKAWAWTSGAFWFSFLTAPRTVRAQQSTPKWIAATSVWLLFTSWFFGPALFERVILASGGECVLSLPTGDIVSVPEQYCFTKSTISAASHPELFTSSLLLPNSDWKGAPRLRRGHDVSGHLFLLTMSVLFLVDQLRPSFRVQQRWSSWHTAAVASNLALIAIWLFASYTTSVYFHSPLEKFTGYLLGVLGYAVTQIPLFESGAL